MTENGLLFRQVHPAHNTNKLSSGAFRPTPNDKGMMSVDCGDMISAETAYTLHTSKVHEKGGKMVNLLSAGTWAFSRSEAAEQELPHGQ